MGMCIQVLYPFDKNLIFFFCTIWWQYGKNKKSVTKCYVSMSRQITEYIFLFTLKAAYILKHYSVKVNFLNLGQWQKRIPMPQNETK